MTLPTHWTMHVVAGPNGVDLYLDPDNLPLRARILACMGAIEACTAFVIDNPEEPHDPSS